MRARRTLSVTVSVCFAASLLAACGSGGSSTTNNGGTQETDNAERGGTLNILGTSDVDYMDPNVSYYSLGYLNLRMWSRQLFSYPSEEGHVTESAPDLATEIPTKDNGGISDDAMTYTIHIRDGVMWNSSPARAVVAQDIVRGIERTCNPYQPFGGIPDFATLIKGYQGFCDGFAKVDPTAKAMADYIRGNEISGVKAVDDTTLKFTLNSPATYFVDMLAMPAFSAAPEEWLDYRPASSELADHLLSDGAYQVESWNPTKEIVYTRNPAWDPDTDPLHAAYVDKIVVDQTVAQDSIQQRLETGTDAADMTFGDGPPQSQLPRLMSSGDDNLVIGETSSTNPYVVFNMVSPNNGKALQDVQVRQALEQAMNRDDLIQVLGGPKLNNPLTHVLPESILGSQDISPYDFDPDQAKATLAKAGYAKGLTLKFLYRPSSDASKKAFQTVQQNLSDIGVKVEGVESPDADFYTKYLQVPDVAKRGVWDLALSGWGSDWFGDAALSYFKPLFYGKAAFPPIGSNFGFYESAATNKLIDQAASASTEDESSKLWAEADQAVMDDAPFFPITNPKDARYHAAQVHNTIYMPTYQSFDPTNVWLESGHQGG
ncbi:MAG: ABC transporter substrate-binding protein [Nocardioides sp.]|nr:ABC transporter substrate-binding protein [Nocardioides sp.]